MLYLLWETSLEAVQSRSRRWKGRWNGGKYKECVRLTKWCQLIFLRFSKVWSMLHHGSVGRAQTKYTTLCYHLLFWPFFVYLFFCLFCFFVFCHKFCIFIIFISFFDEVSNFRNIILTNQKRELAVSNCQWNCMQSRSTNLSMSGSKDDIISRKHSFFIRIFYLFWNTCILKVILNGLISW